MVSPHFDDAVFGAGQWLSEHAGATVATVYAGLPSRPEVLTEWDRQSGFASAGQAVAERREEDAAALALVGASPLWLPFIDSQYGEPAAPGELIAALRRVIDQTRAERFVIPLGLFHTDHLLTHEAALAAARTKPGLTVWAYEDVIYRAFPGLVQQRLVALAADRVRAMPLLDHCSSIGQRKARAVEAYVSQLRAFGPGGLDDATRPERLWELRLS